MKFDTSRYSIRKITKEDGFEEGISYEINLKDGYCFADSSCLNYSSDIDDLRQLIAEIKVKPKETNLSEIKFAAKAFLKLGFTVNEQFPLIVKHPFYEYTTFPAYKEDGSFELVEITTEEGLAVARNHYERLIDEVTSYCDFIALVRKPYLPIFFKYTESEASPDDQARFLSEMWTVVEFINRNLSISPEAFISIFKKCNKAVLMEKEDFKVYNSFPEEVTVYRGIHGSKGSIRALSWTTDKSIAEFFASRFDHSGGIIYSAKIKKQDILAYFDTRSEKEVIVNFKKLYDIKQI